MRLALTLSIALSLSACDSGEQPSQPAETEPVRTCESIRAEVIRIAAGNGINIVKTYVPKALVSTPDKICCSGLALVSSGQEARIFYREFKDAEGDWLVQYSETALD